MDNNYEQNGDNGPEGLLKFQINRNIINVAKQTLFLLEDTREYAQKLEKIVKELGIDNLDTAMEDYQRNRRRILSISNDAVRDLVSLVEKLDIKIKG